MSPFVPEFEGELELDRVPDDFAARIRRRVEEGLLVRGVRRRSGYAVRSEGLDEIAFGAEDFLTAYNVGLNEVRVRRSGSNRLQYRVAYWRWTWIAVGHGALIGALLLVLAASVESMRREIAASSYGPSAFLGLCLFFGLIWPWILTAFHRKFAEKALRRILAETMESPSMSGERMAS